MVLQGGSAWAGGLVLSIAVIFGLGCGEDDPSRVEGSQAGDCTDGLDNDGNGKTDCDDDGCAGSSACADSDGGKDAETTKDSGSFRDSAADASLESRDASFDVSIDRNLEGAVERDATMDASRVEDGSSLDAKLDAWASSDASLITDASDTDATLDAIVQDASTPDAMIPPCSESEATPFLACGQNSCGAASAGDLPACLSNSCGDELAVLTSDCFNCVAANASSLDQLRSKCTPL